MCDTNVNIGSEQTDICRKWCPSIFSGSCIVALHGPMHQSMSSMKGYEIFMNTEKVVFRVECAHSVRCL